MIIEPVFNKFSPKVEQFILVSMVILMYICVCAEADMYVPAFPQMIEYFKIDESKIQQILVINFIGLCISSIIVGPLSDSYGRRIVTLSGLSLFMISSIILVTLDDFNAVIFWRFIQGVAAAIPMVCSGAMIIDKYSGKSSQLVGAINAVITAAMAIAPMVGAFISEKFDWRANFICIMILSIMAFLGFLLTVKESLASNLRRPLNLKAIFKDYITVLSSLKFNTYMLLACSPFITILVYIFNLSVIFVNHLGMKLEVYSLAQASTMTSFVIFSLLSIKLIAKKGVDFTKNIGAVLLFLGAFGLFITSLVDHTDAIIICVFMAILAAGGSFMAGTFGMQALGIFPQINGVAMAACTSMRLLLISLFVYLTEVFFNGTIIPVALIIFAYVLSAFGLYILLLVKEKAAH